MRECCLNKRDEFCLPRHPSPCKHFSQGDVKVAEKDWCFLYGMKAFVKSAMETLFWLSSSHKYSSSNEVEYCTAITKSFVNITRSLAS